MKKFRIFMILGAVLLALGIATVALGGDKTPPPPAAPPNTTSDVNPAAQSQPQPEAAWPGWDGYGYRGESVGYNWVDISTTGTPIPGLEDDNFAGPFVFGFDFPYYESTYSEFYVSSNGFISLGAGDGTFTNQCPLPDVNVPDNVIALMWDDLYANYDTGGVYRQNFSHCPIGKGPCIVVEYLNWANCCAPTNFAGTFEGIFYPDGQILMQYQDISDEQGTSSTEGIENDDAANDYGLTYACNTPASLEDWTAIRFSREPIALEPKVTETLGCAGEPQVYDYTLYNHTPYDGAFVMDYGVPSGNALVEGPGVIEVQSTLSETFQITLTSACQLPGEIVKVDITASGLGVTSQASITYIDTENAWETIEPVVVPRGRAAAAVVQGKIFFMGGETIGGSHPDSVEEYNPATGHWTTKAGLMPTPALNICAAAIGTDIYIPGGYDGATYLDAVQVYHVISDTWEVVTSDPLPQPILGAGCAALDGKLYVFGGELENGNGIKLAYVYDPVDPPGTRWQALPPMANARAYLAGITLNGKIYAIGGTDDLSNNLAFVEAFDPADGLWHPLPDLNTGRGAPGAFMNGDDLVVCGGGFYSFLDSCERYDTNEGYSGSWETLPQHLLNGRRTFGYASLPDAVYAISGYNGTQITQSERMPLAPCETCKPDLSASAKIAPAAVLPGEPIHYTIVITNTGDAPAWDAILEDVIPTGTTYITDSLTCSSGTCSYDPATGTINWSGTAGSGQPAPATLTVPPKVSNITQGSPLRPQPEADPSVTPFGSTLEGRPYPSQPDNLQYWLPVETFKHTWGVNNTGLDYNPDTGFVRYSHENGMPISIFDVAYDSPHPLLASWDLSDLNPGWPASLNDRSGVDYDTGSGHYFLTDFEGDITTRNDNIIEVDDAGIILNAWETDGASNDSSDGSAIHSILDIAVVPGAPPRYFVTAYGDGAAVYEIELVKTGTWWTALSWHTVATFEVAGLDDTGSIDYDPENNLLYISDWNSSSIAITDLDGNLQEGFICDNGMSNNSGITYVPGRPNREVWVTSRAFNQTTICIDEPLPTCEWKDVFFDNFEAGYDNWVLNPLWNEEAEGDACGALVAPFASSIHSGYFGQDGICTYNTGSPVAGTMEMTSDVDLTEAITARLSFWSYEETECQGNCAYDNRLVQISTDSGSTWNQLDEGDREDIWYPRIASVWSAAGGDLRARFLFDSFDAFLNDNFGWMVDNVSLQACYLTENPVTIEFDVMPGTCGGSIENQAVLTDPNLAEPVVITATTAVLCPDIATYGLPLEITMYPDTTEAMPLQICDEGNVDLDWDILPVDIATTDPISGTVPFSDCVDVSVLFDSHGYTVGVYTDTLVINSNDPDEPVVNLPLQMTVIKFNIYLPTTLRAYGP